MIDVDTQPNVSYVWQLVAAIKTETQALEDSIKRSLNDGNTQ